VYTDRSVVSATAKSGKLGVDILTEVDYGNDETQYNYVYQAKPFTVTAANNGDSAVESDIKVQFKWKNSGSDINWVSLYPASMTDEAIKNDIIYNGRSNAIAVTVSENVMSLVVPKETIAKNAKQEISYKLVLCDSDYAEDDVLIINTSASEAQTPRGFEDVLNTELRVKCILSKAVNADIDWEYTLDESSNTILMTKYVGVERLAQRYGYSSVDSFKSALSGDSAAMDELKNKMSVSVEKEYRVKHTIYKNVVLDSEKAFNGNTNIESVSFDSVTIKDGDANNLFDGCTNLKSVSNLPDNITSMSGSFNNCTSLTTAPDIPSGVMDMYGTFSGCSSLTTAPSIPDGVQSLGNAFLNCSALTVAPDIPNSVTNMYQTFKNCALITQAPDIPESVTELRYTFQGCPLSGSAVIFSKTCNVVKETFDTTKNLNIYVPAEGIAYTNMINAGFTANVSIIGYDDLADYADSEKEARAATLFSLFVSDENEDKYADNRITLKNYIGTAKNVNVYPAYIEKGKRNYTLYRTVIGISEYNGGTTTGIFAGNTNITSVNIWDGVSIEGHNAEAMFYGCNNLVAIVGMPDDVDKLNRTYQGCNKLLLATTNVYDNVQSDMTAYVKGLSRSSLASMQKIPSETIECQHTYEGCSVLADAPVIEDNDIRRNNAEYMFKDCTTLTKAPAIPEYTTSLDSVFEGCTNLTDVSEIVINNRITSMNSTFKGCTRLASAPSLSNATALIDLTSAYENCTALTTAPVIPEKVTNVTNALKNCTSLSGQVILLTDKIGSKDNVSYLNGFLKGTNRSISLYSKMDGEIWKGIKSGKFSSTGINDIYSSNVTPRAYSTDIGSWSYSVSGNNVTLSSYTGTDTNVVVHNAYLNNSKNKVYDTILQNATSANSPFYNKRSAIKSVEFKADGRSGGYKPVLKDGNGQYLFKDCSVLTTVTGLVTDVDISNMAYMMQNCSKLTNVGLTSIPSSVTNLQGTFQNCSALTSVPSLTGNTRDLTDTFNGCRNLTTAPSIPSGVTILRNTFKGCVRLAAMPNIAASVTNMSNTFNGCSNLKNLTVLPSNLTNMQGTFNGCTALTSAPTIPSKVTDMSFAFNECTALATAPGIIPISVTNMQSAFNGCTALNVDGVQADGKGLNCILIENTNISSSNLNNAFSGCSKAVKVVAECGSNTLANLKSKGFANVTASGYGLLNGWSNLESGDTVTLSSYTGSGAAVTVHDLYIDSASKRIYKTKISNGAFYTKRNIITSVVMENGVNITDNNADSMFSGCTVLKSVSGLPNTITSMENTFYNCTALTGVSSLSGMTGLKNMRSTFEGCTALTTAPSLPNSVTDMLYTFMGCESLTSAPNIPTGSGLTSLSSTFNGCTSLRTMPTIPSNIKSIAGAFQGCTSLVNTTSIPGSVTNMSNAFNGCTAMTSAPSLTSASALTNMQGAFSGCIRLKAMPDLNYCTKITDMGSAFYGCTSLTDTSSIPSSVKTLKKAFQNCTSLTTAPSLTKGHTALTDMSYAFYGCTKLTTPVNVIPGNVTDLSYAFYNCSSSSLTSAKNIILLGSNNISTYTNAFTNCKATVYAQYGSTNYSRVSAVNKKDYGLLSDWSTKNVSGSSVKLSGYNGSDTSVIVHNAYLNSTSDGILNAVTLGTTSNPTSSQFYNKRSSITSVSFDSGVTILDNNAQYLFKDCTALKSVSGLPSNVTNMKYAFSGCTGLTSAPTIPSNVTDVSYMFDGCTKLTSAPTIPSNVVNMSYMFNGCTALTSASSVPSKVTNMKAAFKGCTALRTAPSLTNATAVTILEQTFYGSGITSAPIIPTKVTNMASAFENCSSLVSAPSIPNGVTDMTSVFNGCTAMTSAPSVIPESVVTLWYTFNDCKSLDSSDKIIVLGTNQLTTANSGFGNCNATVYAQYNTNNYNLISAANKKDYGLLSDWSTNTVSGSTVKVSGYNGSAASVVVHNAYLNSSKNGILTTVILGTTSNPTSSPFYNKRNSVTSVSFDSGVTILDNNAQYLFKDCTALKSVSGLPSSITNMKYAFYECTNLTSAPTIPSGVTNINSAFQNSGLTSAPSIPSKVTDMAYAFSGCTKLVSAPSMTNASAVTDMNNAFYGCTAMTSAPSLYYAAKLTNMQSAFSGCTSLTAMPTMPNSTTVLTNMAYAFYECSKLTTVKSIPSSVTTISNAFKGCTAMTSAPSLTNAAALTNMRSAFYGCTALKSAPVIPNKVTDMGYAFYGCTGLTTPPSIIPESASDIGYAFYNCNNSSLTSSKNIILLGSNNISTYSNAFYNCKAAVYVQYNSTNYSRVTATNKKDYGLLSEWSTKTESGSTVTLSKYSSSADADAIVHNAYLNSSKNGLITTVKLSSATPFSNKKSSLTSVTIDSGVAMTDNDISGMFSGYTKLKKVSGLPDTITDMEETFFECTALTSVQNLSGMTELKNMRSTFEGCTALTTAPSLPNSVTNMLYTFMGCESLTSAPSIPTGSGLTGLNGTFRGCTALTTMPTIPSNITNIANAFYGCTALTSVKSIPSKVTNISYAFYECTGITTAPSLTSATALTNMNSAFYGCSKLSAMPTIPSGVTNMSSAFRGCTALTSTSTIPANVTDMSYTFYGCTALTTIPIIPNKVTNLSYVFYDCSNAVLPTTSSELYIIPASVTKMQYAFYNCNNVSGHIKFIGDSLEKGKNYANLNHLFTNAGTNPVKDTNGYNIYLDAKNSSITYTSLKDCINNNIFPSNVTLLSESGTKEDLKNWYYDTDDATNEINLIQAIIHNVDDTYVFKAKDSYTLDGKVYKTVLGNHYTVTFPRRDGDNSVEASYFMNDDIDLASIGGEYGHDRTTTLKLMSSNLEWYKTSMERTFIGDSYDEESGCSASNFYLYGYLPNNVENISDMFGGAYNLYGVIQLPTSLKTVNSLFVNTGSGSVCDATHSVSVDDFTICIPTYDAYKALYDDNCIKDYISREQFEDKRGTFATVDSQNIRKSAYWCGGLRFYIGTLDEYMGLCGLSLDSIDLRVINELSLMNIESTFTPTSVPTVVPTIKPMLVPTIVPTTEPTFIPTEKPIAAIEPTVAPTAEPTNCPAADSISAAEDEKVASSKSTAEPTAEPTPEATAKPTGKPTSEPTAEPTLEPTAEPTVEPTAEPTLEPTVEPTAEPTLEPTAEPTLEPTSEPKEFAEEQTEPEMVVEKEPEKEINTEEVTEQVKATEKPSKTPEPTSEPENNENEDSNNDDETSTETEEVTVIVQDIKTEESENPIKENPVEEVPSVPTPVEVPVEHTSMVSVTDRSGEKKEDNTTE